MRAVWIVVSRAARAPSACQMQAVSLRAAHHGPNRSFVAPAKKEARV